MKTKTNLISLIGLFIIIFIVFQECEKGDESNIPPSCEIIAPSDGDKYFQGVIVTVSVVAADSDGNVVEVKFFIDDKSKGSVTSSPYVYDWNTSAESIGNHTVKAMSFDNEGAVTAQEITIEIIEGGSIPVSEFTVTPTSGDAPLTVAFTDQSTNNPTNWHWDFGDNSSSSEQNPSNTYDENGTYSVSLTVSNEAGSETLTKDGLIAVGVVAANFSSNPTGGQAPLTVVFTDESSSNPTSWQWDFGDGNSSSEQSPSHSYNDMGLYDVTLTVNDEIGSDTETKANFITVNGGNEGVLIDARDEQSYKMTTIGNQTWFAKNMNYETSDSWWYDNLSANGEIYGRLYTWEAANMTCPDGWHLPSDDEWKILEGTIDSQYPVGDPEWDGTSYRGSDAGRKLKSKSGWSTNNGTDEVGFNALPGGAYYPMDGFDFIDSYAMFWTSTETSLNSSSAHFRELFSTYKIVRNNPAKTNAFSVRCIED